MQLPRRRFYDDLPGGLQSRAHDDLVVDAMVVSVANPPMIIVPS
jgi:hypothetical protein